MSRAGWLVLALASCTDDLGPRLDTITPTAVARGATATLAGERMCGERDDCATAGGAIRIGIDPPLVQAAILEYSETSARLVIPTIAPLGPTQLVLTVNDRASNALAFEVLP